jgi:diguanylate cyclase (GGDEF)-like protein/PAS domain S-box-containing protein
MIIRSRLLLVKIVFSYVILALAWIALSDRLPLFWAHAPADVTRVLTLRMGLFVVASAMLLALVLQRVLPLLESDQRQARQDKHQLHRTLRGQQSMITLLRGVNQAIVQAHTRQELFDQVCQGLLNMGMFRLVWVGSVDQAQLTGPVVPVAAAGEAQDFVDLLAKLSWDQLIAAGSPSGLALQQQQHVIDNHFSLHHFPSLASVHDYSAADSLQAGLAMPVAGGGFSGTLALYADEPDFFDDAMVAMLLEVGDNLSQALKKLHETELQAASLKQLQRLAWVFDESRDGILISDGANNILLINPAMTQMFGYSQEEVRGQNPRMYFSGRNSSVFYREMWTTLLRDGAWQGEIWNRCKDGELLPCWAKLNVAFDSQRQVVNYFGVYSDRSERKAKEELQWLKRFDVLTLLPNRAMLQDCASDAIVQARHEGHEVALLSVNLNRFHYVNETLGNLAADKVLQMLADRFYQAVGESGTVARVSGGVFVVLLPEVHDRAHAIEVARRLLNCTVQAFELDGTKINQTICIGIALSPTDGEDFETLFKHADAARIEAVETGSNLYCFYVEDLNLRARQRLGLLTTLHQALENDWFVLHYQPQVDSISGQVTGVEALLRLQHPQTGLISPADFIPVAEESGMIIPIGAWVMREACAQLKRWQRFPGLTMAINLSPLQLQDDFLADTINQTLLDTQVNPGQVEFEFTESALMRNSDATLAVMHRLKGLGVRLSIDDFGTGYSSLSYLKQFPIDRIKIDQSFVRGIPGDQNDEAIVQAIVVLARALGLATIGEGVESASQVDFLRVVGCNEMQGYHFSRPARAQDIEVFLEQAQAGTAAR